MRTRGARHDVEIVYHDKWRAWSKEPNGPAKTLDDVDTEVRRRMGWSQDGNVPVDYLIDYARWMGYDCFCYHANGHESGYDWFAFKQRRPERLLPKDFGMTNAYHVCAVFVSAEGEEEGEHREPCWNANSRYGSESEARRAGPPKYPPVPQWCAARGDAVECNPWRSCAR